MPREYEEYYNVRLFNDIHNYFPELLYGDLNQFSASRPLLEYIRNQIRNHYDLFSSAQRNYRNSLNSSNTASTRVTFNIHSDETHQSDDSDTNDPLTNLITSSLLSLASVPFTNYNTVPVPLEHIPTLTRQRNFMEPVIVRPSERQVQLASSVIENLITNEICSICQDTMEGTQQIRRINHCNHTFHNTCIMTWFRRNVHCPVCRHDVRGQ